MTLRPDYPAALDGRVLSCAFGHYPWDDWERAALAAGVPEDLAGLGRLTMREAYQHQWSDRLKSLCGWRDDGKRMTKLALRSPGPPGNGGSGCSTPTAGGASTTRKPGNGTPSYESGL